MAQKPHLLVIRLSAMGDVAMTVPVLKAFTETYPHIPITVVSRPFFKPLFTDLPSVSFFGADVKGRHRGISGIWALSVELAKLNITAVADLHHVLRSRILRTFLWLRGYPFKAIRKGRVEKAALTDWKPKTIQPIKATHQRYADVFADLGYPIQLTKAHVLPRRNMPEAFAEMISSQGKKPLIGIAPFAAFEGKQYPEELMRETITSLSEFGTVLLFGGGKKEVETLASWSENQASVLNMAGTFSFEDELAIISNLSLMVGMDSGNGHLAAVFGVPVITLWGITHPYAGFAPYAQPEANSLLSDIKKYPLIPTSVFGNRYPEGYADVMRTIPPERIVQRAREILG